MVKYSFIVPVYNTEKYLVKCLDSLVGQTYKNFEIIIVNDGSTDNSNKIVLKYQKKYKNINVINQKNEGLSAARNDGLKYAKGKYIIFVDSDDYVSSTLLENVDKNIEENDILRFQIATVDENYTKINEYHEEEFTSRSGYDAFKYLSSYHFVEPAWCYVIKRDYYEKNKFKFKKGVYHEDFGLIPYVIYKASKVKSVDFIGYYYVQRNGSIMNNNDYKKTVKKAFDMLEQYKAMISLFKNINKNNNLDNYFLSYMSNSVIVKARELKDGDKNRYIHELKKINAFDGVLVNTKVRRLKKYLMKHNLSLYLKVAK